jgi:renalase
MTTQNENVMQHAKTIAIIGAGFAGATLAQRMLKAGYAVSVFDKSRGTGGRMASARLGQSSADLGAPFIEANNDTFSAWLTQQPDILAWQPLTTELSDASTVYVAKPRQSALTRRLLTGATLITSTPVKEIWPEKNCVLLRDALGHSLGCFDTVIVTAPAQQAAALLDAVPRFAKHAARIKPTPAWVCLMALEQPSGLSADMWMGNDGILFRAIRDSAKPGRDKGEWAEIWSLEATPEWSQLHLETDKEVIASQLLESFKQLSDGSFLTKETRVHRWLYSRHNQLDSQQNSTDKNRVDKNSVDKNELFLWSEANAIGACGDWFSHAGAEGAWLSANALADTLLKEPR